jgi:hypothetical protein
MSAFTNASASSGILRSEIPQLFFSEIKTSVFAMLVAFTKQRAKWKTLITRINDWEDDDVQEELDTIQQEHPDIDRNFQYTVLKAIKAISTRNGNKDARIKLGNLQKLSLLNFYRDFVHRIVQNSNVQTSSLFLSLRPSDKEIVARDAFRQTLFAHSRNMFDQIVQPGQQEPTLHSDSNLNPDDSVSQAPSEVISIRAREDERLSESILKLHNSVVEGGGGNKPAPVPSSQTSRAKSTHRTRQGESPAVSTKFSRVSAKSYQRLPPPTTVEMKGSHVSNPVAKIIVCDIESVSKASRRSKSRFTRSGRLQKVPDEPCFFEDDGIDVNTAEVGTTVHR